MTSGNVKADTSGEHAWTRHTEYPLAAAAALSLAAYAWPILNPAMPHSLKRTCALIVYVVWALFAVDYLCRLALARHKRRFVWRNMLDLISIALPVLRPLRLLRLIALLRVLNRKATSSLHGRVAVYVGSSAALIIFVAALAVLDAERGKPHANINTFGDALWWAATTVMTVGYGDRFPVTTTGRLVAVGLMIAGITLLGIVTASIATWLINRVRDLETDTEDRLSQRLDDLHHEITEIRQLLTQLAPPARNQAGTPPAERQSSAASTSSRACSAP